MAEHLNVAVVVVQRHRDQALADIVERQKADVVTDGGQQVRFGETNAAWFSR
jgi:hypothetical protein